MSGVEWEVFFRALVAALLGYVVGAEREYIAHREAGTSTFSLVSLSSATVTAAAFLLFDPTGASRVVANVLVGVGFLGGGMIVKDLVHVRGLTTAAGTWAMASAGIIVGAGHYALGIAASVLVLLLFSVEHLDRFVRARFGGTAGVNVGPDATQPEPGGTGAR
jgi:putative Mg2+ transporter-C (MgtC) family protein